MNLFFVFLGGGVGASARYLMSGWAYRVMGSAFPYGTLIENVLGCFFIGILMTGFEERFLVMPSLRIFLTVGILGGFTTFSAFSFETMSMMKDAGYFYGFINIGVTLVTCLGATYVGTITGKLF